MARTLFTTPFPEVANANFADALVITPHRAAASSLGVSYCNLPRLAREVLRKRGITVASAVLARYILKKVISRNYPDADPSGIASRIREILQTVLRTGIDVDQLIEIGSPRVRQLGVITKAYRDELMQRNYIDRSELLWAATNCDPEPRSLLVYGHHRARKEEIAFINAIAGDGSSYFLPCQDDGIFTVNRGWADWLNERGWQIDDVASGQVDTAGARLAARFVGLADDAPDSAAMAYPNVEAEVRGVLAEIKQIIVSGSDPYGIAIVCRSQDDYAAVIAKVAAEYGLPVQIKSSLRLSSTVFGGFVRLLLDASESDLGFEATARLLMHPFGPGIPDGEWKKARIQHTSGGEAWRALGVDLSEISRSSTQSIGSWSEIFKAVFAACDVRKKAALRAREIIAFEKFIDSLEVIAKLEGPRTMVFDEFAAVVMEVLADEAVSFATASAGVTLYEPNTILGATFDHLFVVGMAEGTFPAPASENPVIDFYERKQLVNYGIDFEEAAEVARWEALSFYFTLLAGRSSVSFSYPMSVENGERMESSFFDRLGIKAVKASVDLSIVSSVEERRSVFLRSGTEAGGDSVLAAARSQFEIEFQRENSPVYDEFDGVIDIAINPELRRWSVSQLTTIGQCGFRWFAQKILRLEPVEEMEIGLDPATRGKLYHKALEIAVGRALEDRDIRAATIRHLEGAFAEAETNEEVRLPVLANWDLQRTEHVIYLRKAVEAADFIREGARVVGLEQEFNAEWQGFRMNGTIDRVDETPDGLVAIDYKTSSAAPKGAKDATGKLSIDIQLPIYSQVALKHLYPGGKLGRSAYYSLTKGKVLKEVGSEYPAELDEFAGRIKKMLADGNFAVDPDVNGDACKYCSFDLVCRKGPRIERKMSN